MSELLLSNHGGQFTEEQWTNLNTDNVRLSARSGGLRIFANNLTR